MGERLSVGIAPLTERELVARNFISSTGKDLIPISLSREERRERSVAVIVICYQHGRFLPDALASLYTQTLPAKRIIVVDDASPDPETLSVLDRLDRDSRVTLIRLPTNSGLSAARNRGLAEVTESYVLSLDADDMLPPRALEEMVDQLETAPESVGFIYPNIQHFGNRHDYCHVPAYNLNMLLHDNYCVATSLFDSRIFQAGMRYSEDDEITCGYEDWDLILQLAERGIYGEAAKEAAMLYRKLGFSRVSAIAYGPRSFHAQIVRRYPRLFQRDNDRIKVRWAPALSLVLVDGSDGSSEAWPESLAERLEAQTCHDFETLCVGHEIDGLDNVRNYDVRSNKLTSVEEAVHAARGRFVLIGGASLAHEFERSSLVEQIIRLFWSNRMLRRYVIASLPGQHSSGLKLLSESDAKQATPRAVVWRREPDASYEVALGDAGCILEDIILRWQMDARVTWRAA
jgi:glycosyltransferase involved in cell wall biosynthesis